MQPFKVFLAFNKIVINMHICASLSRTRDLPEADKILTDK